MATVESAVQPAEATPLPPSPKRILVLGGSGMLGADLLGEVRRREHSLVSPGHTDLDVTFLDHLQKLAKRHYGDFDWVINCTAYTAVDKAEQEIMEAEALNAIAPGAVAHVCRQAGWRFLHVSTDFVFDGESQEPYREDFQTNPLGIYGKSKLHGERNATQNNPDTVIARTAWLYGPNGKSFPRTLIGAWLAGKDLRVVADQTGTPTYTGDLARVLVDMVEKGAPAGIYHTSGPDAMTWRDFAQMAIEAYRDVVLESDRSVQVQGIATEDWPTPARRPRYSVLDFTKTANLGIEPMRPTSEALREFARLLPPFETN